MNDSFLSQEEIDALLKKSSEEKTDENMDALLGEDKINSGNQEDYSSELTSEQPIEQTDEYKAMLLTPEEKDALGEVGNIGAGSASTALSNFLGKRVVINVPRVWETTLYELYKGFQVPYILIEINYISGIEGINFLILKKIDAAIIADLMMGGTGENVSSEMDELKMSALSEAMNQMMGSSATAMSTIFQRKIEISPPVVISMDIESEDLKFNLNPHEEIIAVSFNLQIEDLLQSEIIQVMPSIVAKQEVDFLFSGLKGATSDTVAGTGVDTEAGMPQTTTMGSLDATSEQAQTFDAAGSEYIAEAGIEVTTMAGASEVEKDKLKIDKEVMEDSRKGTSDSNATSRQLPIQGEVQNRDVSSVYRSNRNLDLILDVPLRVSVLLGKTKKSINEILNLTPGSIVELEKLADEPVDILVNNTLIARGEVVVVNENFGVRINSILSPETRMKNVVNNS